MPERSRAFKTLRYKEHVRPIFEVTTGYEAAEKEKLESECRNQNEMLIRYALLMTGTILQDM
jgi:hypothetical protein